MRTYQKAAAIDRRAPLMHMIKKPKIPYAHTVRIVVPLRVALHQKYRALSSFIKHNRREIRFLSSPLRRPRIDSMQITTRFWPVLCLRISVSLIPSHGSLWSAQFILQPCSHSIIRDQSSNVQSITALSNLVHIEVR